MTEFVTSALVAETGIWNLCVEFMRQVPETLALL
jgi:hypothetical protein